MFNTFLNGVLVSEPMGLGDLEERLYFNSELAMFLNKIEGDIIFDGDGYNTLRDAFINNVCTLYEIRIENTKDGLTYDGIIFINDIEWNLSKRHATCKIVSDKYIQSIGNNRGVKVQLGITLTKNLDPRSTVVQTDITLPDPTGTINVTRYGYRVFDVFSELVEFVTDGQLTFVSDYFDPINGNDASYSVIMTGEEVRLGAHDTTPLISWNDFFDDINKLHNLAGVIEGNTLRIEPKTYFRQLGESTTIEDIDELLQESNRKQFYASVKFGSAKVADGYGYLIKLSYNGFQKEQFFLEGECNINNELNLELQTLITDTNIIQNIQPAANGGTDDDSFDEDIVIIHCNDTNTAYVTISPLSTDYYYNDYFTNKAASQRWAETYPFSIIQLLDTLNPLVHATLTSDQNDTTTPTGAYFSPDNDSIPPNYDTGNDYQIGSILATPIFTTNLGYFEAPSDMVVTVLCDFRVTGFYHRTQIWHVDNLGEIQTSPYTIDTNPNLTFNNLFVYINDHHVLGGTAVYMPQGTRIYIKVGVNTIHAGGTIEIVQTGAYGGVYELINQNNAYISQTSFEYPVDSETWSSIRDEKFKRIRGTFVGGDFTGYLLDATRNIQTGKTQIETYQRKQDVNG